MLSEQNKQLYFDDTANMQAGIFWGAAASPLHTYTLTRILTTLNRTLRSQPASGSGIAPAPPTPFYSAPVGRIPAWLTSLVADKATQ